MGRRHRQHACAPLTWKRCSPRPQEGGAQCTAPNDRFHSAEINLPDIQQSLDQPRLPEKHGLFCSGRKPDKLLFNPYLPVWNHVRRWCATRYFVTKSPERFSSRIYQANKKNQDGSFTLSEGASLRATTTKLLRKQTNSF